MFKIKKPTTLVDNMGEPTCVGNWKREKELGSGAFGVVYLWINKIKGDSLAVKKCKWRLETNLTLKQRERWTSEVEMMKKIENENIIAYRNMPEELAKALLTSNVSGLPILSMEYCALGNLRNVLVQTQNCCGLPELDVVHILKDMSNALKYLHALKVTHRDVKPENIVLQHSITRKKHIIYKLIDLGYAKELGDETVSFVGTLQYLAPEIFARHKYNQSVDYWSLGITTFEIICGIRPFLPAFTPWQCNSHLEKKPSDVIAIQMTHTGDIELLRELLKENHLNMCLRQKLEKWLKSVLEFDAQKRGLSENNADVFQTLQCITEKKIITVFSVYTYEFYSYEVNDSTLFGTLQDWISRDTKIQKGDQFLVTSKLIDSNYAADYYDEMNSECMVFVFKKNASVSNRVCVILPKLIKIFFINMKTEFKYGSLKLLYSQAIYLISQESKHVNALTNAICFQSDYFKIIFDKERKMFVNTKKSVEIFLSVIEFYNNIESSLFIKVYKNTNNDKLKSYLSQKLCCLQQLEKIIHIVNAISNRQNNVIIRNKQLQCASNVLLEKLGKLDFCTLCLQATKSYEDIMQQTPVKNLSGGSQLFRIVSETIKIRNMLLKDNSLLTFLKCATNYWKELNKLISGLEMIQNQLEMVKKNLDKVMIKTLEVLQELPKNRGLSIPSVIGITNTDIINENTSLRYNLQESINTCFLKHKNIFNEINKESALNVVLENGF